MTPKSGLQSNPSFKDKVAELAGFYKPMKRALEDSSSVEVNVSNQVNEENLKLIEPADYIGA